MPKTDAADTGTKPVKDEPEPELGPDDDTTDDKADDKKPDEPIDNKAMDVPENQALPPVLVHVWMTQYHTEAGVTYTPGTMTQVTAGRAAELVRLGYARFA